MKNFKGFSLLEMLIYLAILLILLVVIINVVTSVVASEKVVSSVRHIQNAATLSLERIGREVRQAENIDSSSVIGSHPGRLVLVGHDEDGLARTVEFYWSGGQVYLRENGLEIGPLTQSNANVTTLVFRRFSGTNSSGIRTEMTIESGTSTNYRVEKFYSTTIFR